MHKALHPRDDVHRQYEPIKEEGRGFANIHDSLDASIQQLENYIKNARRKTDYIHQKKKYWQHNHQ